MTVLQPRLKITFNLESRYQLEQIDTAVYCEAVSSPARVPLFSKLIESDHMNQSNRFKFHWQRKVKQSADS